MIAVLRIAVFHATFSRHASLSTPTDARAATLPLHTRRGVVEISFFGGSSQDSFRGAEPAKYHRGSTSTEAVGSVPSPASPISLEGGNTKHSRPFDQDEIKVDKQIVLRIRHYHAFASFFSIVSKRHSLLGSTTRLHTSYITMSSLPTKYTVGDYLAERLAQIGIRHHFVVPGDYNLVLLDKLQANPNLTEVGCANELNCSLAAEGYARANGVSACVVTFSVGALSAFNGTGSAYAENLPLILISGSPNTNDASQFHLLHHTLGTTDYSYQLEMAKKITCCAVAIARAHEAPRLIDRAIRHALLARKPCYIEIPTNLSGAECVRPGPISAVTDPVTSDKAALEAAANCAAEYLSGKLKPVILVGPKLRRAGEGAEEALIKLAEAMGCAVAVQPAAKGMFPEDHKQFVGIFWGTVSTDAADSIVHWADALLCVGTVFTDYSTVGWTAMPDIPLMAAEMDHVTFPGAHFSRVRLGEFLSHLATEVKFNNSTMIEYNRLKPDPVLVHTAAPGDELTRKEISRQIQAHIDSKTTLFVETGDSWFNGVQFKLPPGALFEIEMAWGHIGWSIPAAFGYALRHPDRKIVVMVGDGSFQVTAQEVSQMVRFNLPITIILINNRGYTIEVEIHDGSYNKIKNWNYALLVHAFNGEDGNAKGLSARTAGELQDAIKVAEENTKGPTLIECSIDQDDCSRELITWGHFVAAANARPPRLPGV